VPLYNEFATREAQNALNKARAEGQPNLPDAATPVYHWVYRPEMSFSVYDLTVRDITIEGGVNNAFDKSIINLDNPVIGTDSIIDVFLTLMEPDNNALDPFGPGQELILSFAGDEYQINTASDIEQAFIQLDTDYFSDLSSADFLTISIFLNNDSANTLWEFAFSTLDVDVDSDNNNGLGLPDRSPEEELVEDVQGQPGKILIANLGDEDGDGIPNFADFDVGAGFAPMVIEIPDDVDIATAKIRFTYEQSDPNIIIVDNSVTPPEYIPADGYKRLWTKNGTDIRNQSDIDVGGDFIRNDRLYNLSLFGLTENKRDAVVYIELVRNHNVLGGLFTDIELITP